jgi:hypothetical protein
MPEKPDAATPFTAAMQNGLASANRRKARGGDGVQGYGSSGG